MGDNKDQLISMLVLSCDNYSDLWDDFFNIKDIFWPDCEYQWYLVTESVEYHRKDVKSILCGKDLNWTGRLKKALSEIRTPYIGFFLEDYFFEKEVDNCLIDNVVAFLTSEDIDYYVMYDQFSSILDIQNKEYLVPHIFYIPRDMPYGLSTAAALWKVEYLEKILGDNDVSAWQFEMDRCVEAKTKGFHGKIVCDDRMPFRISHIPVVTQGKFTPGAIQLYKRLGIVINKNGRAVMSKWDYYVFITKLKASKMKFGKKYIKWAASKMFGMKFFSTDQKI